MAYLAGKMKAIRRQPPFHEEVFMKRVGKRLRILRGGSGFTRVGFLPADRHIRRGGGACVAPAGGWRVVGAGRLYGGGLSDIAWEAAFHPQVRGGVFRVI